MDEKLKIALNNIGAALANEGLKLSQKEHLQLVQDFNLIKETLEKETKKELQE